MPTRAREDGGRPRLRDVVERGLEQFTELSGQRPERVSGVRKTEDGFSILVDVVDLERVPTTTSVMSTYRVDLSSRGDISGYERLRRFTRSSVDG